MIGKTISHYRILDKLGEGGMGVVFKAQDTKLDRFVALKFLPQRLSQAKEEKKRFIHEAKAASALDHSNICTIHEIDETKDGQMFIVMTCYDGESLKDKIEHGTLTIDETLEIAIQIAEGLSKAHSKKIVHRDIKPGNILITKDDQVKIVDFGLAKLLGQNLTKRGTTKGTVKYMSPEQAQGLEVDDRTDVWALGVVLYEMLTGRLPFKGELDSVVIYSIVNEKPEAMTGLRSSVPIELERIIEKALAKNPKERYKHVDKLLEDLKICKSSQSGTSPKLLRTSIKKRFLYTGITLLLVASIIVGSFFVNDSGSSSSESSSFVIQKLAVLPFSNIGDDPHSNFLGFALTNQVIGALSYFQNILVRSSSVVRPYENQTLDAQTAGQELKVDFILMGYYLKEANNVRLNLELIAVNSNEILWREAVEVKYENTFMLQDIVSQKVIDGLKVQFSADEMKRRRADIPQNPLAYEYYLRSISYPSTTEGNKLALTMVKKSILLDSTYAPAYVELGSRHWRLGLQVLEGAAGYEKAEQSFMKALSLNAEELHGLAWLAWIYTTYGKIGQGVQMLRKALQINPNNAGLHFTLSTAYSYAGMLNESVQELEKALALDPGQPGFFDGGHAYFFIGDIEKAIETFRLAPKNIFAMGNLAYFLWRSGQRKEALELYNRILNMEEEETFWTIDAEFNIAYLQGDRERALQEVQKHEQANLPIGIAWFYIAEYYALLEDKMGCVRALEKAIELDFFSYPFMIKEPLFHPFRDDPEFQSVLAKAKTKHEAFKKRFFFSN